MFKLLVADDEESIRRGIIGFIDWKANGVEVCGEAEDGMQALEIIREAAPDIMLIDIRMPEMSGLEVIKSVQDGNLPVKSIIISGYDDFTFAQEALKLDVSNYLMKPCRPEEILEAVLAVKREIEEERSRKKVYDELSLKFNKNLPLIRDNYLARLISFESGYKEKLLEDFKLYNISIHAEYIAAAIVRIDNIEEIYAGLGSRELELLRFSVRNILGEVIGSEFKCEVFENDDGIIMLSNVKPQLYRSGFVPLLEKAREYIRGSLDFSVSIGVGKVCSDISDIRNSYGEALEAVEAHFLASADSVIVYEELPEELVNDMAYPVKEEKKILNGIQSGNPAEFKQGLEEFFMKLHYGRLSRNMALKSCMALVFSFYHLCVETQVNSDEIFGHGLSMIDSFMKIDTHDKMKDKLLGLAKEISEKMNSRKNSNKIIEQSLKYIGENYNRNLSLEKVAGSVFVNPRYYCLLFRQTMGINFVDYINKLRVEHACDLLKDVRLKTYEVAEKVGFSDNKYFCSIFKKYKGVSPTQYRGSISL